MDFDELAGNETAPGLDRYISPATIGQHQSGNPDLYRQHNPAGRMNDLTRQASGYDGAEPGTGRAQYMGETPLHQWSLFTRGDTGKPSLGQRVRDLFNGVEPQDQEDGGDDNKEQEEPAYTAPQEQQRPNEEQPPTFATSPAPPLGTHTVHGYGSSGAIRTPGTTGIGTSYNLWGD